MVQPLALLFYEKLLPGSQLVNRLQDLQYRVHVLSDPEQLIATARTEKPLVILADLGFRPDRIKEHVLRLKTNPDTQHLPVIGFAPDNNFAGESKPNPEGVAVLVSDTAILSHLAQILDRALQVD